MLWAASKENILTSLDRLARVVKSNPRSIDILQCVLVETADTRVFLTAVSSMASVRVEVQGAKVSTPGRFVVNFDRFRDRLSKTTGSIALESDGTSLRIISSEDQKLGLSLNDVREFPETKWELAEESYTLEVSEVTKLFEAAHNITSKTNALTPAFLQVRIEDQKLWVASGISYQVFPLKCNPNLTANIPNATLVSLVGFIKESSTDKVWISQHNEDSIVVTVGSDQFQATPLAVTFPSLEDVFTKAKVAAGNELVVPRHRLITELTNSQTSADEYGRVMLKVNSIGATNMEIRTSSPTGDWYESTVPVTWVGEGEKQMEFTVSSLVGFLRSFPGDTLSLWLGQDYRGEASPMYVETGSRRGILNQFRI